VRERVRASKRMCWCAKGEIDAGETEFERSEAESIERCTRAGRQQPAETDGALTPMPLPPPLTRR